MKKKKKKRISSENDKMGLTILGVFLCAILIPLLFCNISLIIQGYQNPNVVPGIKGYKPMMVLTDSMAPTIKSGDLIIIKEIDPNNLKVGDIITFFDPAGNGQSTVTHTIKSICTENGKLMFETQGDNNNAPDRLLVESEAVVGVYLFRLPMIASVAMFMQTVPGLILCIFAPLGIFIWRDLRRRRLYEKEYNSKTQALIAELSYLRAESEKNQSKIRGKFYHS